MPEFEKSSEVLEEEVPATLEQVSQGIATTLDNLITLLNGGIELANQANEPQVARVWAVIRTDTQKSMAMFWVYGDVDRMRRMEVAQDLIDNQKE